MSLKVSHETRLLTLYTNHWTPADAQRRSDIDESLRQNISNPLITRVVVLAHSNEEHRRAIQDPKLIWLDSPPGGCSVSFEMLLETVNTYTTTPYDLNIIASLDVVFDDSLGLLDHVDLENVCLALSRWERTNGSRSMVDGLTSQDAWIFQGRVRPLGWTGFPFGARGGDGRFAWELKHNGYYTVNPGYDVKVHHVHDSSLRHPSAPVLGPTAQVEPRTLADCRLGSRRRCQTGVIAFSLYGSNDNYTVGAITNALLAKYIYPGWVVRFYIDESVPEHIVDRLRELKCELIRMPRSRDHEGMFWRFLVADEPGFERWIVRDCDSRLNYRERLAVDEWIASGLSFHVIRDHELHAYPIMGGLCGGTRSAVPGMRQKLEEWTMNGGHHGYCGDQQFLQAAIWPIVKDVTLVHDSMNGRPLPAASPNGAFVGERICFDEHHENADFRDWMISWQNGHKHNT